MRHQPFFKIEYQFKMNVNVGSSITLAGKRQLRFLMPAVCPGKCHDI